MNAFALMATLGLDSSAYNSGLDKAKSAGSALGKGLATAAKVGIAAVGAATTAVVGFGASSVKTGMDFDKSMSQVAATMGKTMEEMQNEVGTVDLAWGKFSGNLREYAQEMGKNTAFSATEAADALNYMALAGYDTQTSMSMLPNVLNLAAAGNMELARASDMVTDTQTAFGISLERTSQMVDEMAKAASTGNTSVEQLGDAFLTVGGLAKELNGGMVTLADGTKKPVDGVQELEIALTAMANAGIKGGEAGTHMRNMLLKLSDPTDDGVAQMKALGVSVFDTEGNMRSLSSVMGDLNTAMGSLTQEEKIQAISDLFNTRDMASAEALLASVEGEMVKIGDDIYSMGTAYEKFGDDIYDSSKGYEIIKSSWNQIGESILNAEGAAQKMADTQLDNLAGDVVRFKSALEGAQITISNVLSPSLREFVQFGTSGLSQLTDAFQKGGLTGAVEAFGKILSDGLNMIISKMPEFVDAGMKLLGALGQGLLDNLDVIIDAAGKILVQLVEGLVKALPKLVDGAIKIIGQLAIFLGENLPTLIPAVIDMILGIVDALIDNVDLLIDGAIALVIGLAEGMVDAMPKLIDRIPEIVQKIVDALIRNAPKLAVAAGEIIGKLAMGLIQAIPKMFTALGKIVTTVVEYIGKLPRMALEWGADLIAGFIDGIKSKITGLKNTVSNIAKTVKDFIGFSEPDKGPLSNFHTFAPDMMELFAKGITDNLGLITDAMDSMSTQVVGGFDYDSVSSGASSASGVESILLKYLPDLANMQVVLNTGELVGATADAYDAEFGSMTYRGSRR